MKVSLVFRWAVLGVAAASLHAGLPVSPVSPFQAPDQPATATAPTESAPIEFRGVFVTGSRQQFSFFDPGKRQSFWVGLNEAGADYRVTRYEADTETATVEGGGRTLTLTLHKVKIASAPAPANVPPAPAANFGAAQPAVAPPPVVLNPTPADEAKRLEAIAAEVRRRRALRQQTMTTPEKTQ
ncbi:MAG TPA: hypothetical protein PKX00_21100 [Opitutaceae bacterium]|nr:hypothetical protein [Opitutaceae bacterium]